MSYIDGPTDKPWAAEENPWAGRNEPIWWVCRNGYNERVEEDGEYEWRFGVTTDCGVMEAEELARRLNEADALRAEVEGKRRLVQAQQGAYADLRADNLRLVTALIDIQALYGGTEAGEIARAALEEPPTA